MSFISSFTKKSSKIEKKEKQAVETGCIDDCDYIENVSIGNYIIIKELGSGSTAKVVLAFEKSTGRKVAIKIVRRKNTCFKEDSSCKTSNQSRFTNDVQNDHFSGNYDSEDEDKIQEYSTSEKKHARSEGRKKTINFDSIENKEYVKEESRNGKSGFTDLRIYREIVISSLLDHPHIVKLLDFFYSKSYFFLVFEHINGTQLYDVILKNTKIDEDKARKYFRQILSAIDYIHGNSIVHRDLKIENIIIDNNDNVKILDFGLSNFYDNKKFLYTFCGSLYFAAPELLMGRTYNGPEVDVWSLGVILYVMLCGKVPFDDESVRDLQLKIKEADYSINVTLSPPAIELINRIIVSDPAHRMTISEVLNSDWVNMNYQSKVENYLGKRFPLTNLNFECVEALSAALSFQFHNVKEELENYLMYCKSCSSLTNGIYWTKSPVVSLYYLLLENISSYSKNKTSSIHFNSILNDLPEVLHRFVSFIFASCENNRPSKFFQKEVFENENAAEEAKEFKKLSLEPSVKSSYIKGLFQGIRIKHIGSKKAIKRILIDIFKKNSVTFEADENGYYCSYRDQNEECYFKVSLYYNVILSDYYLILKCLNNKKESFKTVYTTIQESLKYKA